MTILYIFYIYIIIFYKDIYIYISYIEKKEFRNLSLKKV